MKANELMVGDWVSCFCSCYQVESIETIHPDESVGLRNYGCELAEQCEPIPLTAEILEKNGFEVCYESCYQTRFHIWLDEETCVEYKISKQNEDYNYLKIFINGGVRVSIPIRYIHELQHALRLCGLNELADNFKI